MNPPERILIRLPGSKLGDFMMTTPMLVGLRRALPDAHITLQLWPNAVTSWLPPPGELRLYDDLLWDDSAGAYSGAGGYLAWVRELKSRRFDAAVSLHGGKRTAWSWWMAKIPVRIGNVPRELGPLFTRNDRQNRGRPDRHEVEYNFDMVRPLGLTGSPGPMVWQISEQDRLEANQLLDSLGRIKGRPLAVVNPTHGGSSRLWQADRFAAVAAKLASGSGVQIALIGSKENSATSAKLLPTIANDALDLTGATSLPVLAAILEKAALHLSIDTGTMHLAAAVGTPCVTVMPLASFWDSRIRWQPWATEHRLIGPSERCTDCIPGLCRRRQTVCIDSISVDQVTNAARQIVELTSAPS